MLHLHFSHVFMAWFLMNRADFTIIHSSQDADKVRGKKDMKNEVHSACGKDK